jgi:hypothetical protein
VEAFQLRPSRRKFLAAVVSAPIAAGVPALATGRLAKARALTDTMRPGDWRELPDTRMQSVFPSRTGHPAWGIVGPSAVTGAWGGAAYDTRRNILVVTGGGHGDYGGNEVYEFSVETLRWTRATEPSPMREVQPGRFEVSDGSEAPVSSHTYDGLLYLPNADRVFKFGGSYYGIGYAYDLHAYLYDTERKRWERRAPAPFPVLEVASAYYPATGEALVTFDNGLLAYHPGQNRWRIVVRGEDSGSGRVGDLDVDRGRFVQLVSAHGPVVYFDLRMRSGRRVPPNSHDFTALPQRPIPGIGYDAAAERFVVWQGGRETWALDARRWEVAAHRNEIGSAPDHRGPIAGHKTHGIYGRWQYVPDLRVFIGYSHSTENVWLYRSP